MKFIQYFTKSPKASKSKISDFYTNYPFVFIKIVETLRNKIFIRLA
jgi:hypothetical protein